jgi:hypothetical protein
MIGAAWATTAKRDKKERSPFLSLLIYPPLSGYPFTQVKTAIGST